MNKELIKRRYEFAPDGRAIIDISVESISDLFNSFDKRATFTRRELDQDFVEYVVDCVQEIGDQEFFIRVVIDKEYNMLQENNLRKAIFNHFSYLQSLEKLSLRKEVVKFFLLLLFGIAIMAVASLNKIPDSPEIELWKKILQEGVVIAGWVAFWEATTTVIFGWSPIYNNHKIYTKIVEAELRILNRIGRFEV